VHNRSRLGSLLAAARLLADQTSAVKPVAAGAIVDENFAAT
jgi:hypothetical protein